MGIILSKSISYEKCCDLVDQDGKLDLRNKNLDTLPEKLPPNPEYPNLTKLSCFNNQLTFLPEYPIPIYYLSGFN